jgi:excisionase family DNA binding protein
MTVQQVAEEAGVSDSAVYRWVGDGKIPAYRLPGTGKKSPDIVRIARKDFEAFLKGHYSRNQL